MKKLNPILLVFGLAVVLSAALYLGTAVEAEAGCGNCESHADHSHSEAALDGGCECPVHTSGKSGQYKVGDKVALHAVLSNCCGKEVDLEEAHANSKTLVLAFYSARCPVVKDYNQRLVKLVKEYEGKGVSFLAVNSNVNETASEIHQYRADNSLNFHTLIDKDSKLANAFQAEVTPHIYVIDKGGVLRYRGPVDDDRNEAKTKNNYLRAALDAVLNGENVKQAEVDAFGCAIRRL